MNLVKLKREAEMMYINGMSENRIVEFVNSKEDSAIAVKNILNKILGKEVYMLKEGNEFFDIFVSSKEVAEDCALTYNATIIKRIR